MHTMAQSVKTPNSNSAPLMTKNSAKRGEVHLSAAFIKSADWGQRLQNTVPNIMQTRREEKLIVTGPRVMCDMDRATVRKTREMVMFRRFVLE